MPRITARAVPRYRLHKASGRAVVTIHGRDHYLGVYDSPESHARYGRLIAEVLAGQLPPPSHRQRPEDPPGGPSIAQLAAHFWVHAQRHYRKAGRVTQEVANFRQALRPLVELYGDTPAGEFGPLKLKAVREAMIRLDWCRNTVNRQLKRLVAVFGWAVAEELVGVEVHQALLRVRGVRRGAEGVRETRKVRPVADADVQAVLPHLTAPVRAIVRLLRHTGARAGEIVLLRPMDLSRTDGDVWLYTPGSEHEFGLHKTADQEIPKVIAFGPRCQEILRPLLAATSEPTQYVFRPADGAAEWRERQRADRVARGGVGNHKRPSLRRTDRRQPTQRYSVSAVGRSITRACRRAAVAPWHLHQLRHTAATDVAARFDLATSQAVLGHASAAMTRLYAEMTAKAVQVARVLG